MAIDTALKRASAINVGCPWRGVLPVPSGTVNQAARQAAARLYSGILAVPLASLICALTISAYPAVGGTPSMFAAVAATPSMFPAVAGTPGAEECDG